MQIRKSIHEILGSLLFVVISGCAGNATNSNVQQRWKCVHLGNPCSTDFLDALRELPQSERCLGAFRRWTI